MVVRGLAVADDDIGFVDVSEVAAGGGVDDEGDDNLGDCNMALHVNHNARGSNFVREGTLEVADRSIPSDLEEDDLV